MSDEARFSTVFVVMPYGRKKDPASRLEIDFDDVWNSAFRPAAEQAGLEAIRADEERVGGFVQLAMFERLLLAEVVLADLTLASPNVMYELGIRHATRPRATISVFARVGALPFDLAPIRAVPYQLDRRGRLGPEARAELVDQLVGKLHAALTDTAADSPLFQLIKSYPGVTLPHDVTESFQDRVRQITALSNEIRSASRLTPASTAVAALKDIETRLGRSAGVPTDLLVDLLLGYRDVDAYDEMIGLFEQLPDEVARHPAVQQVGAFALTRRNEPGDDRRAIEMLQALLDERGPDPETLGLLGRWHKDRHKRLSEQDPFLAGQALDDAIAAYERGFQADMRDYYPGVNAVTLLMLKGTDEAYQRARELSPVVAFAVAARGGLASTDYWDVATVLELAVVNLDEATARGALRRLLSLGVPAWKLRTTRENLERLQTAHRNRQNDPAWLGHYIARLFAGDP
ncbi:TRAFs-binding domain-containing protein [Blastococcus sp. SYSU DS0539]